MTLDPFVLFVSAVRVLQHDNLNQVLISINQPNYFSRNDEVTIGRPYTTSREDEFKAIKAAYLNKGFGGEFLIRRKLGRKK